MNWSLAFEPLISWPLLAAVLVPLLLLALVGLWFRQRGAIFRFAALLALGAALLNPVFLSEEREALKSVVALVVDRSQSQDIGERTKQTDDALAGLVQRLGRFKQFDVRVVEAGKSEAAEERTDTRLFGALERRRMVLSRHRYHDDTRQRRRRGRGRLRVVAGTWWPACWPPLSIRSSVPLPADAGVDAPFLSRGRHPRAPRHLAVVRQRLEGQRKRRVALVAAQAHADRLLTGVQRGQVGA